MATGDIRLVWGAWSEIPWAANNQEGLADGAITSAWSDEVDLSGASVIDYQVALKYRAGGSLSQVPVITVLAVGDANGGYAPVSTGAGMLVGNIVPNGGSTLERGNPLAVGQAFGGVLPSKLKFGIVNNAGSALSATTDEVQLFGRPVHMNVAP